MRPSVTYLPSSYPASVIQHDPKNVDPTAGLIQAAEIDYETQQEKANELLLQVEKEREELAKRNEESKATEAEANKAEHARQTVRG